MFSVPARTWPNRNGNEAMMISLLKPLRFLFLLVLLALMPVTSIVHAIEAGTCGDTCVSQQLLHGSHHGDHDRDGTPSDTQDHCCDDDCCHDSLEPPLQATTINHPAVPTGFRPYVLHSPPEVYLAIFVPPER